MVLTVDVLSSSLDAHVFASPSSTHHLGACQVTIQLPTSIYCTPSADEACRPTIIMWVQAVGFTPGVKNGRKKIYRREREMREEAGDQSILLLLLPVSWAAQGLSLLLSKGFYPIPHSYSNSCNPRKTDASLKNSKKFGSSWLWCSSLGMGGSWLFGHPQQFAVLFNQTPWSQPWPHCRPLLPEMRSLFDLA